MKKIKQRVIKFIGYRFTNYFIKLKYKPINLICSLFSMKNYIIFESNPDFTDNTYQVYRKMCERGINEKMKMIWLVDHPQNVVADIYEGTYFLEHYPTTIRKRFKKYFICNRSKMVITCNRYITKVVTSKKQLNIYLGHGALIKSVKDSNGFPNAIRSDYIITQSSFFNPYIIDNFGVNENQIICTGYPRNDLIFSNKYVLGYLYSNVKQFEKIILWMPTFRRHKDKNRVDCNYEFKFGIPVLNSYEELKLLEKTLFENQILLIIKTHPAQDMDVIKNIESNNIRLLTSDLLEQNGVLTEQLFSNVDALVTDYSSVYYDFLLTQKPIAITLDDYEEYKQQHGIVFDDIRDVVKGKYVNNIIDLCAFVEDIALGRDMEKDDRTFAMNLTNEFQDPHSADRVVDFIMQEAKERKLI